MSKASFYGGRGVTPNNLDVDPVEPNNINAIEDSKNAAAISEANAESHKNTAAQHASDANTSKLAAQASEAGAETARTGAEAAETGAASSASSAANSAATATTKASEASASAAAAATSATGAQGSATLANTERVAAGASALAADTSRVAAQAAQAAAETAQTAAETAETNAATSASNAATSESSASSSASAAASSATTSSTKAGEAAASASNAATSETNAASSATAASGSETAAAASATAASGSATTASTKASEASASAAAASNSASNASTYESNASTSASNAATSETNASNSASAAATSASNASTSETNASNSAAAAASSASAASTSASNAATSETNAASSATAAAASATTATNARSATEAARDSALAALDSFDDRYLGVKSSDPTVDNDGNALVAGALYYNDTDNVMKVYEGSSWVAAYASVSGALLQSSNLSDLDSAVVARTNLGLGTAATTASTDYATAAQGTKADTAHGWGDHSAAGYAAASHTHTLSQITDAGTAAASATTDFATAAQGTKADTAHSWGDHSTAGYAAASHNHDGTYAAASHNHDDRYYTETEADSRFLRGDTSDTMSGNLTVTGNIKARNGDDSDIIIGEHPSYPSYGAVWLDGESDYRLLADPSNGHTYLNAIGSGHIYFRNDNGTLAEIPDTGGLLIGNNWAFHQGYHPNADKWTTARTLSLSGDASGSVSWDGSANATLNVTVANDSHSHSNYVNRNAVHESNLDTKYDADLFGWTTTTTGRPENYGQGISIVSSGNTHNNSSNWITQLGFGTAGNTAYFRTKVNSGGWGPWQTFWHNGNDGSGSGLDADLLDGVQGASYARKDIYNSCDAGLQVFRNLGTATGSWQDGSHTMSLENSDGGYLTLNFHRAGYTSNNLLYTGTYFRFDHDFISTGNVTAYSDERLKDNVVTIENALDKVSAIRGVTYNRNDLDDKPRHTGVIAQEVEKVLPEVVQTDDDGIKTVAYGNMVGLLIEAIKEQQTQIDELKAKLEV